MTTTFFAMLEFPDESPGDGQYDKFCFFDSVSKHSLDTILSNQTLAMYADRPDGAESLQHAVWQVATRDIFNDYPEVFSHESARWWQIEISDDGIERGVPATFLSLAATRDQDVVRAIISNITAASTADTAILDKFFTATGLQGAKAQDITNFLNNRIDNPRDEIHVAVYDMGQANCNAIVNRYEHPLIFFDLGWPIQANSATVPANKPELFVCESAAEHAAPVVLSHWDWDHWAYAIESWHYDFKSKSAAIKWNGFATARPWVVPRPTKAHKLGPSHWGLFAELFRTRLPSKKRALTIWPRSVPALRFSRGLLVHCSPARYTPANRNNTGLALFVSKKCHSKQIEAILLPADAEFSSIALLEVMRKANPEWQARVSLVGIVASHHGGKVNVYAIPQACAAGGHMAVSNGLNNTYGHPNQQALTNYTYRGWTKHTLTETRVPCPTHSGSGPHHQSNSIVLSFTGARKPKCGCKRVEKGFICLN